MKQVNVSSCLKTPQALTIFPVGRFHNLKYLHQLLHSSSPSYLSLNPQYSNLVNLTFRQSQPQPCCDLSAKYLTDELGGNQRGDAQPDLDHRLPMRLWRTPDQLTTGLVSSDRSSLRNNAPLLVWHTTSCFLHSHKKINSPQVLFAPTGALCVMMHPAPNFLLFHSAQCYSVTAVTLDQHYNIN